MLENKSASLASEWIRDTPRANQWNSAKVQWQTKPVIFGTVTLEQIDLISPTKSPETP